MSELSGLDFILSSDVVQDFGRYDARGRHEAGPVTAYVGIVW